MFTVQIHHAHSANEVIICAIFQDSTASAIAARGLFQTTANGMDTFILEHEMAAGTTSATTFKVRIGSIAAGTTTINGHSGVRKLGGVQISSIEVVEVSA